MTLVSSAREGLDRFFWAKLLILAVGVRVLVSQVFLGDMPLVNDAVEYARFASELASGMYDDQAYYWPPGTSMIFSVFYQLFGSSLFVTQLFILLVEIASVVLVVLIGAQFIESKSAVRFSGYLYALYTPAIMLSGQLYSHHVAGLCVLAVAYFGVRALKDKKNIYFLVAGLFLGLGILTRPSMMALVPVLFFIIIVSSIFSKDPLDNLDVKRLVFSFVIFVTGVLVMVVPVLQHNHEAGAGWTVSTNNERNFFIGNNKYTPNYKTWHFASRPDLDDLDAEVREYFLSLYEKTNTRDAFKEEAINYIIENPGVTIIRTLNRARAFWGFDYVMSREIQKYYDLGSLDLIPLVLIESGAYFIVMVLVLVGLCCYWKNINNRFGWWLLLLVLAYEAPYVLAFSNGFYHYPVIPLLMPFAGLAIRYRLAHYRASGLAGVIPNNKIFLVAFVVFVLIQIEYGYYLFEYM